MKLAKVLDGLNSLEKNSFIKIIDNLISDLPKKAKQIEKILNENEGVLKNADNVNISKIFNIVESQFSEKIKIELSNEKAHLDIIIDIIIRDGNCIMSHDWLTRLYEKQYKNLNKKLSNFKKLIDNEKADVDEQRRRDYRIFKSCVNMAYHNDEFFNRECKITIDEQTILNTLSNGLDLSHEENRLITCMVITPKKLNVDDVIRELKDLGVLFYNKKSMQIYIPDEIVRILRILRGKKVADKYYRRVLKQLKDPMINLLARKHNIHHKLSRDEKIKSIIHEGLDFEKVLISGIFKDGTSLTERKVFIAKFIEKDLNLEKKLKGATASEKIQHLISYFDELELDEKISISIDGYDKLLFDFGTSLSKLNRMVKEKFQIQGDNVLNSELLLNYNIKPRDILDLIDENDIMKFCNRMGIKTRGNDITNIIEAYKDAENLFLENYANVANRDLKSLKENDIIIKEADLGSKFESLTGKIFNKLGFNVDSTLLKGLNTKKDKIDLLINLGNQELIIIECKTSKDGNYNKFSSVSRQIKSYQQLAEKNGFRVIKSLLVAGEFSDDFVSECEIDYDLNLSLITAPTLIGILNGFKKLKKESLPYKLLLRDVLINEDRILKAISR